MKIFHTLTLALILAGCGSDVDDTRDPKAINDRQAGYTRQMCKCTEAADPKACGEKIDADRTPWFVKVRDHFDAGKVKFDGEGYKTFETETLGYAKCRGDAGLTN